jgi:hypothetical protein
MCKPIATMLTAWILLLALFVPAVAQRQPHTMFKERIGLSDKEIAQIDSGQVFTKVIPSDDKLGLLVFGATYVNATVERFADVFRDVEKLEEEKVYLVVTEFGLIKGDPVTAADFKRLEFSKGDIDDLADCEVGDCDIQFAHEQTIEKLRDMAQDKAVNRYALLNQELRKTAAVAMNRYMQGGLKTFGSYKDRKKPLNTYEATKAMVDSSYYLPKATAPDIYNHVVDYPSGKMEGAEDIFYWENIDFGQGPTVRVNHVSLFPQGVGDVQLVAANKQLYASKYMRVALQMYYCIKDTAAPDKKGFYLLTMNDSRLPDFKGLKLSIVRKVATGKAVEGTHDTLDIFKRRCEK